MSLSSFTSDLSYPAYNLSGKKFLYRFEHQQISLNKFFLRVLLFTFAFQYYLSFGFLLFTLLFWQIICDYYLLQIGKSFVKILNEICELFPYGSEMECFIIIKVITFLHVIMILNSLSQR